MDLRCCWGPRHKKTNSGPSPWWTRPGCVLLLLICIGCSTGAAEEVPKTGKINDIYEDTVTSQNETIYAFVLKDKTEGVRVSVKTLSQQGIILVNVQQKEAALSFRVPLLLRGDNQTYPYPEVARTLCLAPTEGENLSERKFFVEVSTLSMQSIRYQLRVSYVDNFTLQAGKNQANFTASPSKPQYFKYVFPENVSTVIVHVSSVDNICSVLSIQDIQCPVYDLYTNVDFMGMYQTITKRGAITVQKEDFPSSSFYLVVVVKPEDKDCRNNDLINAGDNTLFNTEYRTKEVHVVVSTTIKRGDNLKAILFCVGIFLSILVLTILVGCLETCCKEERESPREDDDLSEPEQLQLSPNSGEGDANSPQPSTTTQTFLFVSDLAQEHERTVSEKYYVYIWNITTIAVFYGLPVMQLVMGYQKVVHFTGRQDLCYYNFLCAHPLGPLRAFNNVFSNIGYVLLGFLFIAIVHRRDRGLENNQRVQNRGIPQHFGLFYTMGTALIVEGVCSGCYHICPKDSNFQFDTSFMYMLSVLSMLQIYQKRHPDITASAHVAFAFLAAVVFFCVVGEFLDSWIVGPGGEWLFWAIFSLIHILTILYLTIQLYYTNRWKQDSGVLHRLQRCVTDRPVTIRLFIVLLLGNIFNWCLAVYGLITRPKGFASHLLKIAIMNLLLYFIYYIIMKYLCKEFMQWWVKWKSLKLAIISFFTAVAWVCALSFYVTNVSSWEDTPAKSREFNRDCYLLNFFDHHDVWHFLSAIALFGTFLVLLIIDDNLETVQQDKIHVF